MTTTTGCPRCGTNVTAGTKFCSECGNDVTGLHGAAPSTPAATAKITAVNMEETLLELLREATLGEFEILKELGRGGMAMVYLGHDISLNRKVALKVMSPTLGLDASMAERFVREAQTAASLSHPNIIPVYAVKNTPQVTFFVMKFIQGRPLDDIMEEVSQLPIPMVTAILSQVSAALGYGHKRGIVHRDVKPGNVMIDEEGWAIVTDFGIAKVEAAEGLTQTGAAIGTPTYMSPEQCTAKPVTGASDQYSLGVMAYEMIAGKKPFDGDSVMSIMYGHVNEPPQNLRELRPDCPPELADVVHKMLGKKADDRFAQIDEIAAAVSNITPAESAEPARTEMINLASSGIGAKLLSQVRTPRSPIPLGNITTGKRDSLSSGSGPAASGTDPDAATVLAEATSPARPSISETAVPKTVVGRPAKEKSKLPLVVGLVAVLVVGGGGAAFVAMNGGGETVTPPPEGPVEGPVGPTAVSHSITVSPQQGDIIVGDSYPLAVTVTDGDGNEVTDVALQWQTSDANRATVSDDGTVVARAEGPVVITASTPDGSAQGTVALAISAPPPEPARRVNVASIVLSDTQLDLVDGSDATVRAELRGDDGSTVRRPVTWESDNPRVATVSGTGANVRILAIGEGQASVRVTSEGQAATIRVSVSPVAVARVALDPPAANVNEGSSIALQASLFDAAGNRLSGRDITWTSSSGAAQVTNGTVQGVSAGTATITATAEGGAQASAQITVDAVATVPTGPTGPTEEESRADITAQVDGFWQAFEDLDIRAVRAVYPSIPAGDRQRYEQMFETVETLGVSYEVTEFTIDGSDAQVRMNVQWTMRVSGRNTTQDFDGFALFRLNNSGWRMSSYTQDTRDF